VPGIEIKGVKRTRFQLCRRLVDGKPAGYLRPRFLLALILLVITMSTIAEADCWEDSLKRMDRDILVMGSEAVYQVVPEDEMTSVFWLPPAHTTVCDSIVDVGGIPMLYYQLRNWDGAVTVWATRER
jgi:hypothetical protein